MQWNYKFRKNTLCDILKMALEKRNLSEIPSDAIVLSEEQAIKYHTKVLYNWKNKSDIFAYKYGSLALGTASMVAGTYLNNYFRIKFKLLHYGRIASYLPMGVLPAVLSVFLHQEAVLRQIVLLKQNECPVCVEMRAVAVQCVVGCVLPLAMAPVTSLLLVHKYETFNMPYVTQEPSKALTVLKNQIKPIKNVLFGILVGQALIASAVTYFEAKSVYNVNFKLLQMQKEIELGDSFN